METEMMQKLGNFEVARTDQMKTSGVFEYLDEGGRTGVCAQTTSGRKAH